MLARKKFFSLTLNNTHRFGDSFLSTKEKTLRFSILGYSQDIANNFENTFTVTGSGEFDKIIGHSPIVGWAYDGNPIYGPFGYSDPDNINSDLKIITPSKPMIVLVSGFLIVNL